MDVTRFLFGVKLWYGIAGSAGLGNQELPELDMYCYLTLPTACKTRLDGVMGLVCLGCQCQAYGLGSRALLWCIMLWHCGCLCTLGRLFESTVS